MSLLASEIAQKLNLLPHSEGGFYAETFRDHSVQLSTSILPPEYKVDRPVSTCIYFLLPSGNMSRLHRIPCSETWHHYIGEPITVVELNETDSSVKFTCLGSDLTKDEKPQYTVPPNVWSQLCRLLDVENINENKVSYGDYGGFGGVYPGNRNYLNNGRGYYGGYPNGGFYPNNGYLINGGGYGGGYPINGGSNVGNGGYGLGYPGNTGGFNGNDFIRTIGDIIGGIVGNIGGGLNGGRRGAAVAVQTKDNTHN